MCGTLAAMGTPGNPHDKSPDKDSSVTDSSGGLVRSAARAYTNTSASFRNSITAPAVPKITFEEISSERRNSYLAAELPDVPFSGIALTAPEKEERFADVDKRLKNSVDGMRNIVAYQRNLADASRTVKEAVAFTVAAIAVFAASVGAGFVCHIIATGILN